MSRKIINCTCKPIQLMPKGLGLSALEHDRECKWRVVEEPKPECDHIVGLRNIFHINGGVQRGFIEVHQSDINGLVMLEYSFKQCPECGEKFKQKKDD